MAKQEPPEGSTLLWKWMHDQRCTLEVLSTRVGCTPQHLSDVRRGARRPSDSLKEAIARETALFEREHGISRPKGVAVTAWFAKKDGAKA